ncbi:MAG: sigma-54-dependent Fis family transcriptional regulator [Thermotogae bacterium]|nr:sigma-54-dependent Fis family transcriptional regulator [Thermotogota bacterium]
MTGRILVVEDNATFAKLLKELLTSRNLEVEVVADCRTALEKIESFFDLVILDLKLPDCNGLSLVPEFRSRGADVLILTAHGDVQDAVKAIKQGAYNFFTKPVEKDQLITEVERVLEKRELNKKIADFMKSRSVLNQLIGRSVHMQKLKETIMKVGPKKINVLITGESGTGKELVARAIHEVSGRKPFVVVNCGAIPDTLFESELFGYEKGAFTGADTPKPGKLEIADGGTVFLDEIAELPPGVQAKLLRFLETSELEKIGSTQTIKVDVRIICATNRNLEEMVEEGRFREDLFYRLKVMEIRIPSLRARPEDIEDLAYYFVERAKEEFGLHGVEISDDAVELLKNLPWRGNVRELKNFLYSLVVKLEGSMITSAHVMNHLNEEHLDETDRELPTLEEMEKRYINMVLKKCKGNKKEASRILGISRTTLHEKLKKWRKENEDP